ncbi:GumC family protein [Pirellulaceae bacterium SH449]
MMENSFGFDSQEIVSKLWHAKWKLIAFQVFVVAGCLAVLLLWPRGYISEARLFLQLGKESVAMDPTATVSGSLVNVQSSTREDEIITALDILQSREVASKVVDALTPAFVLGQEDLSQEGTDGILVKAKALVAQAIEAIRQIDPLSDRERAIINIEKNLKVSAERKSEVIVLKFEAKSPERAQTILATLVEVYKEEHMRIHRTDGSLQFFTEQQAILAKELDDVNERLRIEKNRMGLASIAGQRELLEVRNKDVSLNLADAERSRASVNARTAKLKEDLARVPERINSTEVVKPNSATDMQAQQLYTLQLQATEYETKYQADHPKLIAIRNLVREAEESYRKKESKSQEVTDDVNPIHRDLTLDLLKTESEKAGVEAKLKDLALQKESLLVQLKELNQFDIQITDLERERGLREAKYVAYTNSLEEARLNKELEASRISSVVTAQEATLQERPVTPSKVLVVLFGMALLCAGTLFLAFVLVKWDDRLMTPDSVRKTTGLDVLCTLPKLQQLNRL